jgi:hypothetical protein
VLSATATSGLAVSFASTTPTICTVSETGGAWSANLLIGGRCRWNGLRSGGSRIADLRRHPPVADHHLPGDRRAGVCGWDCDACGDGQFGPAG